MEVIHTNESGAPYVMWGEHKLQLESFPLTDKEYIEKAERELRETPETVAEGLAELRKLLRDETDLVVPIDDDEFLIKFLRPCKYYAESTFKRMQAYYKFRLTHKDHCNDLSPAAVHNALESSIVSVLSPRDQHGRRMLLIDSERWIPREVSVAELFRSVQVALEAAIMEPRTQVNGVLVILDMKGLSFAQVMQFTPYIAKMMIDWVQDCVPIRLKAVHVINQPYIFNMLFAIFKPFMKEKLRSRIHFHGYNRASLHTHIDPSCLRKRHGGDLPEPELSGKVLLECLLYYENQIKDVNTYGYVKSKS
ncbi:hypothetical protein ACJJTC_012036 [Scirpophaga incertulas]